MIKQFLDKHFDGKRVAILGFGLEGRSTYGLLRSYFPEMEIIICDQNAEIIKKNQDLSSDKRLKLSLGGGYLNGLEEAEVIMKAPGIPFRELEGVKQSMIKTQTSIFLDIFRDQTVGITGTKGKSTTAALLHHIMQKGNKKTLLAGNIGTPCFDLLDQIDADSIIVFEMSSHQLENLERSPHIAVFLNVFKEHLDHYDSYESYQQAKMNIVRWQQRGDLLFYYPENAIIKNLLQPYKFSAIPIVLATASVSGNCVFLDGGNIIVKKNDVQTVIPKVVTNRLLSGKHNLVNIMAACGVASYLGLSPDDVVKAAVSFTGLPHRMEYVGTYQGVRYINDSIATVPEAVIEALKAFPDTATLILGGKDRGLDYTDMIGFIAKSEVKNLFFIGEAGKRMHQLTDNDPAFNEKLCILSSSFEEAIQLAVGNTPPGKTVLLSPAASSYDMFRDFKERGERFKALVANYAG